MQVKGSLRWGITLFQWKKRETEESIFIDDMRVWFWCWFKAFRRALKFKLEVRSRIKEKKYCHKAINPSYYKYNGQWTSHWRMYKVISLNEQIKYSNTRIEQRKEVFLLSLPVFL